MKSYDLDVDAMAKEEQIDWANEVLKNADPIAKALDILGWKIECTADPGRRWPFGDVGTNYSSPDWCEDL